MNPEHLHVHVHKNIAMPVQNHTTDCFHAGGHSMYSGLFIEARVQKELTPKAHNTHTSGALTP